MPTLNSQLQDLARSFAEQIVEAIRVTSLQELVVPRDGGSVVGNGRRARVASGGGGPPDVVSTLPKRRGRNGRLPRRSAEEIAKELDKIVLLVKTHKEGMRAEEIRAKLGMIPKEMPRILKEGIAKKKLATKGQKRATTYFAK